jgi:hypothetical protein
LVCFALVFNGVSSSLLGELASAFSWRLYWCVPLPLIAAAVAGMTIVSAFSFGRPSIARSTSAVLCVFAIGVFYDAGGHTYESRNASWRFWEHRTPPAIERAAQRVVDMSIPGDLVLAPPRVAERIAQLPNRPALVSVREQYLIDLARYWGDEETLKRMRLMMLVEGTLPRLSKFARSSVDIQLMRASVFPDTSNPKREQRIALRDLRTTPITIVVIPKRGTKAKTWNQNMRNRGFHPAQGTDRFRVYVRDDPPAEQAP